MTENISTFVNSLPYFNFVMMMDRNPQQDANFMSMDEFVMGMGGIE